MFECASKEEERGRLVDVVKVKGVLLFKIV